MSEGGLTPQRYADEMEAAKEKFEVVRSTPDTLLLDLDTDAALAQFERVLPLVRQEFGVEHVKTWKSKSGHTHTVVTLSIKLPFYERIALQAALGSDGVKEVLSLAREQNGCVEGSALFRPKNATIEGTE